MRKKIVVLGAGLIGSAIAIDLHKDFDVTSVDNKEDILKKLSAKGIKTKVADVSNSSVLTKLVLPFDLVIGAVPGFMGFNTVRTVILAGKNMVDISFFPEDPFELDTLALDKKVTVVTDCGVAPGMGNIILGYHNKKMKVSSYECLVGGLPVVREWPFEYKAVFSPIDVIEEYTRPARYVKNGALVVREALSDLELIYFDGIGTLESFNTDGLRSLIKTMPHIPDMIEKTLRYPGSVENLKVLRETGFFSDEEIDVQGVSVRPIDLTSKLLFPKWKLKSTEEEFTIMRIKIGGIENNNTKLYEYKLLDRTDWKTDTKSMARTTGYTCTAVANLVISGLYNRIGISPPEFLGESESNYNFIIKYLTKRGINYNVNSA